MPQEAITSGGIAYPEPDLSNVGGVTGWMKVASGQSPQPAGDEARGSRPARPFSGGRSQCFLSGGHGFGLEEYLLHPMEIDDGCVTAPDRPGHGVAFNWDALEAVRV